MPPPPPPAFGRRTRTIPSPATPAGPAAPPDALALGESAALFRDSLAAASANPDDSFSQWKRGRDTGRAAAWLATLALLSPGVICLLVQAPNGVSAVVEILGIAANAWLRRRRRAHLLAIRTWSPASDQA